MSGKEKEYSILGIEANLECSRCYKKIHKVLCKLKEKEKIREIRFDNQKNTVTIVGEFNREKLKLKLCCKAGNAIKGFKDPEEKKPASGGAEGKKEEKKPDQKKPDEKKKDDDSKKKDDDKKKADDKYGEKKDGGDEKPKAKEEQKAAAPPPASSTTVNLQFTRAQMCSICYPWPCSDPSHWAAHPQWPPCEGMPPPPMPPAFPGHHQHPHPPAPWAPATPKWGGIGACGGPSCCGECGACRGGWPAMPPAAMCCPGPSSCRGCKGCRIVQEGKFIYEEYPPSACSVM